MKYNPQKIEKKWQAVWKKQKTFAASDESTKPKWYSLFEFPYPSGDGLHVGHLRPYVGMDVVSRKRRMQGYNVLYPIGWDAFGLPTENYAIKHGIDPAVATKQNTTNFRRQMQSIGLALDWDREINTTDPEYYKWTQWMFLKFFEKGLAYKAKTFINWCPKDKIGLANEEANGGICDRCGGPVEKREKEQWLIRITDYAEKLLEGLKEVDYIPQAKIQQENWIGRSEGAEIEFSGIKVFTTRPDTLFGATYLVLAPEHSAIENCKLKIENWPEVAAYIAAAKSKTEIERTAEGKEKTGVELKGVRAINPATKEEIPVWISDFVVATYGTGAIMSVPAHDQRDFEFATKYNLPIREVIEPLIKQNKGEDAVRADVPFKERNAAVCIVKHWSEDKYLCLRWKKTDWHGFVVGGIEAGEDAAQTGVREIAEETGYTSAKLIRALGGPVHSQFYQLLKKENRFAHFTGLYFELQNGDRKEISPEEQAIHDISWIDRREVEKFLNVEDLRILWRRVFGESVYGGSGLIANSGKFSGMPSEEAKKVITESAGGKMVVKYKLRDWVFSRQRYWGEPIPLVHCAKDGWVALPEKDLPLKLPKVKNYQPRDDGQSPLASVEKWVSTKCPTCKGPARRETDTMPNWAGSSWYFLRYVDSKNKKAFADPEKLKNWLPVDWYNGGMEHTVLHLLYSRFWNRFLFEQGLVPTAEPYKKRTSHALILAEGGVKMSKSKGNVVSPDTLTKEFGADALRVYEMFIGPFNQAAAWDQRGILGASRFLEKVWRLGTSVIPKPRDLQQAITPSPSDPKLQRLLNKTIKKVGEDIEQMNFNTAVSAMMIFVNSVIPAAEPESIPLSTQDWQKFLKILSPFAPHITEELNSVLTPSVIASTRSKPSPSLLCSQPWPEVDESSLAEKTFELIIQVNGRVRGAVEAQKGIAQSEAEKLASANPEIKKWLVSQPKRVVYVKDRLINFII